MTFCRSTGKTAWSLEVASNGWGTTLGHNMTLWDLTVSQYQSWSELKVTYLVSAIYCKTDPLLVLGFFKKTHTFWDPRSDVMRQMFKKYLEDIFFYYVIIVGTPWLCTHCTSLSSLPRSDITSNLLPLWSTSCLDHACMELLGDRSRRVSRPEDHPYVGSGERAAGGQDLVQVLHPETQRGIIQ